MESINSKQNSAGFSVSIPVSGTSGFGGSVNSSKTNITSHYASVTEQSGLKAGDNGYQINVKGNTDLNGAVSASAAPILEQLQNKVQTVLETQGMSPLTAKNLAQGLAQLTSASIGSAVGGNQGAATALTVDTNNRQLHPKERALLTKLGKDKAQAVCNGDAECLRQQTIYWTDIMEQVATGLVDDKAAANNQKYYGAVLGTAMNPDSEGAMSGASSQYFTDLNYAQKMLSSYMGQSIVVNGVQATGGDGAAQKYFSATKAQRADAYLNSPFNMSQNVESIVPGKELRNQNRLESLGARNGSTEPVHTLEEVLLGGKIAKVATDAMVIGWRSLEVGLASKTVSSTTGNISASQITEAGMGATLNATERAALAQLDKLPSTALQGAERESIANSDLTRNGFQPMEGKCGSGNCFDGVFVKGDKVYVVETKPLNADGSIKLSGPNTSSKLETQMSDEWIDHSIDRLARSGNPELIKTANTLMAAKDNGTLVKVVTGVNSNGMTIVRLK